MKVREWARRRAGAARPSRATEEVQVHGPEQAAERSKLPRAWVDGVHRFYDFLHDGADVRTCTGTACTFARDGEAEGAEVRCLGRCYEAPVRSDDPGAPIPRQSLIDPPIVLRNVLFKAKADPASEYLGLPDGQAILDAIKASGLRGRGGAAYPTGAKWKAARDTQAPDRYVVANGDEGDPGVYVDRLLLEDDPHAVLAGMVACGRAIGAKRGIVFIRAEYPTAQRIVAQAIAEAQSKGWLGEMSIRVMSGAGSYVAGEETALLRSIEGLRAEPSVKPPYPAERGLDGLPTVVQNVETLAVVPWVVRERRRADTKVVCLNGAVARRGAVEIALGTKLSEVLQRAGGGPRAGARWKMALVGGPMGRVLPVSAFDTPLSFEALPGMGHGGVVVFDDKTSAGELAHHLYGFAAAESCGNCAPCRIGTAQLGARPDAASLERLLDTLELGSLCGFGQSVPKPLRDLLRHFPGELFR